MHPLRPFDQIHQQLLRVAHGCERVQTFDQIRERQPPLARAGLPQGMGELQRELPILVAFVDFEDRRLRAFDAGLGPDRAHFLNALAPQVKRQRVGSQAQAGNRDGLAHQPAIHAAAFADVDAEVKALDRVVAGLDVRGGGHLGDVFQRFVPGGADVHGWSADILTRQPRRHPLANIVDVFTIEQSSHGGHSLCMAAGASLGRDERDVSTAKRYVWPWGRTGSKSERRCRTAEPVLWKSNPS